VLQNNNIGEQGRYCFTHFIEKSRSLQKLNLRNCQLTQSGVFDLIEALKKNTDIKLKELDLGGNDFKSVGAE